AGSVAGMEEILHPVSVARKVMEETIHVMLVGEGAKQFALENGFQKTDLLTDQQRKSYEGYLEKNATEKEEQQKVDENHHDTIALVGVDAQGNLYGGCSTSGWGYKIPGRVGDSPIIGSGLYVDNEVGGAGATGIGENVMRYCASFMIVEEMRHGASPQEAIENVIERIAKKDPKKAEDLAINFVAINKSGETGAAGTSQGFTYAVTDPVNSEVRAAKALTTADIIEGGNQ
ncbi:MAG: isoaspartyl peptidase/L-asparaginase, partial [Planctomycetota bacterium]|nr:isoaspartyl peptidase/L-asparaginase [Planctomycetota bacterium]